MNSLFIQQQAKVPVPLPIPQRLLHEVLLQRITTFLNLVDLPTARSTQSDPRRTRIDPTMYNGAGGYSLVLLRIYKFLADQVRRESLQGPDAMIMQVISQDYLGLAEKQAELCLAQKSRPEITFCFSEAAHHLVLMEIALLRGIKAKARQHIKHILDLFTEAQQFQVQELLYGQVGYLYMLLKVEKLDFQTGLVPPMVDSIIKAGLHQYQQVAKKQFDLKDPEARLVYTFHEKEYLGAAHGLSGILHLLILALCKGHPQK